MGVEGRLHRSRTGVVMEHYLVWTIFGAKGLQGEIYGLLFKEKIGQFCKGLKGLHGSIQGAKTIRGVEEWHLR